MNNEMQLSEQKRKIIIALADNSLNISNVSRELFMHRNTVVYHIEQIKKITGKNPRFLWPSRAGALGQD